MEWLFRRRFSKYPKLARIIRKLFSQKAFVEEHVLEVNKHDFSTNFIAVSKVIAVHESINVNKKVFYH